MNNSHRRFEIAQRLSVVATAHEVFQTVTMHGVYDEQWSDWYAEYLLAHGWNRVFKHEWTRAELAEALRKANDEHRAHAPKRRWQDHYAELLVKVE